MHPKFFEGSQDRMEILRQVLNYLGNPDESFEIIHIIGTNGKGSTGRMVASLLEGLGYRVGLFTSPHIDTIYERIQVNGVEISEDDYKKFQDRVGHGVEEVAKIKFDDMTWFDAFFLIAMSYYGDQEVDFVVLEAGIGGRIDSTNGVGSVDYTIFTKIGMDHRDHLGNTLEEITRVKLGAMRKNSTAILAPNQRKIVEKMFIDYASERNTRMVFAEDLKVEKTSNRIKCNLQGKDMEFSCSFAADYQVENMQTALTFLEDFSMKKHIQVTEDLLEKSLGHLQIAGRYERISDDPITILDGGHNQDGIRAFVQAVEKNFLDFEKYIFTGFVKDKDISHILPELFTLDGHYYFTTPHTDRAIPARDLQRMAESLGVKDSQVTDKPLGKIIELSRQNKGKKAAVFLVGSLYLITDLRKDLIENLK